MVLNGANQVCSYTGSGYQHGIKSKGVFIYQGGSTFADPNYGPIIKQNKEISKSRYSHSLQFTRPFISIKRL